MEKIYDKKERCFGCGACSNACKLNAIQMKQDEEGFFYPVINQDLCVNCGKCRNICPINDTDSKKEPIEVYAAKNISDDVRKKCASGGIFSAISDYILDNNGVVYGAIFNSDMKVVHQRATTKKDRDFMRGSKYVQSSLGDIFNMALQDIREGKLTLFTGTPCQVAGLKSFLGKEYDNLFTCDIVCHGVISPKIYDDYVSYIEDKHHSKINKIYFRDKEKGWSNQKWKIILEDEKIIFDGKDTDIYKKIFYNHVAMRPSCHECPYACIDRVGDITMGDYWGIENAFPQFKDELGVSVVLVNTQKGCDIFSKVSETLSYIESDKTKCFQPQLQYPTKKSEKRDEFWMKYKKRGFSYIASRYIMEHNIEFLKGRIKSIIKKILKCLKLK